MRMTGANELSPSPMPIEELALLECLVRIDGGVAIDRRRPAFGERLVASCLAEFDGDMIRLTAAGIERCRALQHRDASDREAVLMAKVIVV